jgi:hypothetical protein
VAQDLRLNPDAEEGGWDDWEAQPGQIVPVGGKARITRQLRLQPHEVYVVKLAAVGSSP